MSRYGNFRGPQYGVRSTLYFVANTKKKQQSRPLKPAEGTTGDITCTKAERPVRVGLVTNDGAGQSEKTIFRYNPTPPSSLG